MVINKTYSLVFVLLASLMCVSVNAQQTMPKSGEANCVNSTGPVGCQIGWNFSETPAELYFLQRFDDSIISWEKVGNKSNDPYSMTKKNIERGGLYRVAACSRPKGRGNCAFSTVMWIPYNIAADDLPNEMVLRAPNGASDEIASILQEPYHIGLMQFNVYTMINTAHRLGQDLPSMSEPIHAENPVEGTVQHGIRDRVYEQYRDVRKHINSLATS